NTLTATIETPCRSARADPFAVTLRVANASADTVAVVNPDIGTPGPGMRWPFSDAVYRMSLLLSFGYLLLAVTDDAGRELPRHAIETWTTPALAPPVELEPGGTLDVVLPIGTFYPLEPGKS